MKKAYLIGKRVILRQANLGNGYAFDFYKMFLKYLKVIYSLKPLLKIQYMTNITLGIVYL